MRTEVKREVRGETDRERERERKRERERERESERASEREREREREREPDWYCVSASYAQAAMHQHAALRTFLKSYAPSASFCFSWAVGSW
jgi:hypothetical protein